MSRFPPSGNGGYVCNLDVTGHLTIVTGHNFCKCFFFFFFLLLQFHVGPGPKTNFLPHLPMAGDVNKIYQPKNIFPGHETLFCKIKQLLLLQLLNIYTMFTICPATGVSIKCFVPQFYLDIYLIFSQLYCHLRLCTNLRLRLRSNSTKSRILT